MTGMQNSPRLMFENRLMYYGAKHVGTQHVPRAREERTRSLAHELLYPLFQGYDSVAMDVDMEIGGADQMFNMMVGRELMRKIKNKNKFVLTTPLLVDKEGKKIGKTEGNAIAIADPPAKLLPT